MADDTIAEFLEKNKDDLKNFAILIGNGLGKSHPEHGHAFNFDPDYVFRRFLGEMNTQYYDPKLMGLKADLVSFFKSPEVFFQAFRVEMLFIILMYYMDRIQHTVIKSKGLRKLLLKFNSVFTLNYDPIIYWNMPDCDDRWGDFIDGFNGKVDVSIEKIKSNFDCNAIGKPVYYMHGAFHIIEKDVGGKSHYYKIESDGTLLFSAKKKFEEIIGHFREYEEDHYDDPTPLISTHSHFKGASIYRDDYLKYCIQKFKKAEKLLIFGCSFENDQHILEAIQKSRIRELYVCYKDKGHKARLENIIEKVKKGKAVIKYIDSSDIADIIWTDCGCLDQEVRGKCDYKKGCFWCHHNKGAKA